MHSGPWRPARSALPGRQPLALPAPRLRPQRGQATGSSAAGAASRQQPECPCDLAGAVEQPVERSHAVAEICSSTSQERNVPPHTHQPEGAAPQPGIGLDLGRISIQRRQRQVRASSAASPGRAASAQEARVPARAAAWYRSAASARRTAGPGPGRPGRDGAGQHGAVHDAAMQQQQVEPAGEALAQARQRQAGLTASRPMVRPPIHAPR